MLHLESSLVYKLISDQFPQWSDLPIRPVTRGGWDNRTFRLGDDLTVRMPSAESYASQVYKEQRWLPFIAEGLTTTIPQVVGQGEPGHGYLWSWSIYRWIEGTDATVAANLDVNRIAKSISEFIGELHELDASNGPEPGLHNYYRGGTLREYDDATRVYIDSLSGEICSETALGIWTKSLQSQWTSDPVWIHGDLEPSNILISAVGPIAVIDFGNCAVGDPACDLVMAWTFFGEKSRKYFRSNLALDNDTWDRARGWALWKALFRMSGAQQLRNAEYSAAKRLVENIFSASS